jgi:hypothetical protein
VGVVLLFPDSRVVRVSQPRRFKPPAGAHPSQITVGKEGGSIGLNACTCSYMSETGVATVNARAHPALKLLGVKASMATARRHMIYVQAFNPMRPPSLQDILSGTALGLVGTVVALHRESLNRPIQKPRLRLQLTGIGGCCAATT